jgi:hypothetical protein
MTYQEWRMVSNELLDLYRREFECGTIIKRFKELTRQLLADVMLTSLNLSPQ